MKTDLLLDSSSDALHPWSSRLFIGLASVVVVLLGGAAQASEPAGKGHWPVRLGATVVYAGLVAAAPYEYKHGRSIPSMAGAVGGAVAGVAVLAVVGKALHYSNDEVGGLVEVFGSLSFLAGGVLGGVAAHALADSPGERASVTAAGLAPLYLLTLALTLD